MILILGMLGVGSRIMRWLPLPIIMGMFGGSIMGYVTRLVVATVEDTAIAGTTVVGYLLGRWLNNSRVPPVGFAVASGGIAVVAMQRVGSGVVTWELPSFAVAEMAFSAPAIVAVSLPMVVLAMGLGNVQGLGFLLGQGYKVPLNVVSVTLGINSIINSLFGGHPATVARTGVAILASRDAGPLAGRYWASLIAATLTLALAFGAAPVASLLGVLPQSYIFALAGLAILSSFQDALERAFGGVLKFGALVAFVTAATPFAFVGITSAFWAVVAGLLASSIAEREALLKVWKEKSD